MLVSRRVPSFLLIKHRVFLPHLQGPLFFQATLGTPDASTGNASRGIACRAVQRFEKNREIRPEKIGIEVSEMVI